LVRSTWVAISGQCVPLITCCIRVNEQLICCLALSVMFRGSLAITDAAGNTHAFWSHCVHRYIWVYSNKYTYHLDRCIDMKHHHIVTSKGSLHQSITQYDRGLVLAQKIAHISSCTLCMYITKWACSGSKVSSQL